jgi:hypothetical protein
MVEAISRYDGRSLGSDTMEFDFPLQEVDCSPACAVPQFIGRVHLQVSEQFSIVNCPIESTREHSEVCPHTLLKMTSVYQGDLPHPSPVSGSHPGMFRRLRWVIHL